MGKKGGWFSAVKKVLSPESKKDQRTPKSKKKWFGKSKDLGPVPLPEETEVTAPPLPPPTEDVKLAEAENEQSKHAYSVALATAMAAEAAVAAAQAAAEVVRLTSVPRYPGKSKEEIAAIKIQTAFRGYLARRALRALRGLVRLKSLIQGQSVKRQATSTLRCMQTLARVQSQIRARRIRMLEENQALQRQLQQKCEKELEKLRASMEEDWNDSTQSKEQIDARQQNKQEAAMRRERALAYAFSHQQSWKNSSKSVNPTFMDPNNPHWGWSWLERWMAARPWENRSTTDNHDRGSVKSMGARSMSIGEISRAYSRRDLNNDNKPSPTPPKSSRPPSRQSPSTPPSKAPSISSVSSKIKLPSPRGSQWGGDEDSRSMLSVQSERYRRHSIAGSSVRDDESLASSPAVPSYMAPTQSTKARSRLPSPLGLEKNGTPDRGSAGSAKKRLSFSPSPAGNRRHSGPPKVDITPVKDIKMHKEEKLSNGGGR
ncbi:PREDICTED: protein IQ-DOMAIN 1 [Theobroma cacao]|uniref:Protein IQ-DOMAIN 1 n=1 Tax=Theobroma cacao TaxID=3641 RepID=A0AB32X3L7_THECC|nr:PREDICTED: protein IQ-DOMAIN 1 [Theobroma cacao]XP_017985131.1 PREDICTED: protein IQ-DOMAIN 1 [Theobroma cacao]XP_017985132.1 PREDICTED: protein IQ-DOMAIN 1 [Theobroma cacao]XP_017985133.1 PREDICTED: protein IQ-DOMAIN 1 [Theobroma cacao]XP_017985134.1 PREDICTED: protein IQ-DOMAIN 1 [Theobroma cacao]